MPIVPSTTADDFWEWVAEQGYSGSPNDQLRLLLTAEGYTTGNNTTDLFAWLGANGYLGTMTERITAFERANTVEY